MIDSYDEFIKELQYFSWKYHTGKSWYDKNEWQWLGGIIEEVGELSEALDGKHEHPAEFELMQIASCAINMLRWMRDTGYSK
jgi:hypothetical protein